MVQPTTHDEERLAKLVRQINHTDPWRVVNEYLVDSNDSNDLSVDGSGGSPQVFSYTPDTDYDIIVNRLVLFMECSSAMSTTNFGNIAALGQGITIHAGGVQLSVWQDNIDIYTELFDIDTLSNVSNATVDTTMHGEWQFARDANGQGIQVENGDTFEVIVNDDISAITTLRIRLKGLLTASSFG